MQVLITKSLTGHSVLFRSFVEMGSFFNSLFSNFRIRTLIIDMKFAGSGNMPTLSIVTIDEEMLDLKENVLRQKALEVPVYTSWYLKWCEKIALEMFEIMYTTYGAALAAPQVGIQLRLIVMDPARVNFGPHALINPIITYKADNEEASSENCLSLPQLCGRVRSE